MKTYFTEKEFSCNHCGVLKIELGAEYKLNQLRELDGKPMILTSAYRCPEHNRAVGGTKNSYHMKGMAFDIRLDGRNVDELAKLARSVGFNGIGKYKTFLHIDTRKNKATWHGKG